MLIHVALFKKKGEKAEGAGKNKRWHSLLANVRANVGPIVSYSAASTVGSRGKNSFGAGADA
jgi:hypothetical protein